VLRGAVYAETTGSKAPTANLRLSRFPEDRADCNQKSGGWELSILTGTPANPKSGRQAVVS